MGDDGQDGVDVDVDGQDDVVVHLVKAQDHISVFFWPLPRVDDRVHCCSKGEKANLHSTKVWPIFGQFLNKKGVSSVIANLHQIHLKLGGGEGDHLDTCLARPVLNFDLSNHFKTFYKKHSL